MTTLVLLIAFILGMIAVGFWGMKRTASVSDFVLGGRNIGPWILAFSFGTSYFSAVLFIGFAGKLGWLFGLDALWIAVGNSVFGALVAWMVLGRRTRRMTHRLNVMTMPEFFEARYESAFMRILGALIIFIFLLPYSASVFKGLGHLFEVNFGISYILALFLMTSLTGIYLVLGGYIAAARTDFIQGIIMLIGSVVIVGAFLWKWDMGLFESVSRVGERYAAHSDTVIPPGPKRTLILASLVFMTSFGTWGLPQMIQKYYAIKDEKMIRTGAIVTGVFAIIVVTCAYFLGALAHTFTDSVPGKDYDRLVPEMMTAVLPEPIMALVLLLVLSASMSTLAALTLVSSSAVAVDVLRIHTRDKMRSGRQVHVIRALTVLFLLFSFGIAVLAEHNLRFIVDLMSLSWGTVAGSFMAPYLYGLFWKGTTRAGAIAGMMTGLGTAICLFFAWGAPMLPVAASVAMIVPFLVVPVVSAMTARPSDTIISKAFDV